MCASDVSGRAPTRNTPDWPQNVAHKDLHVTETSCFVVITFRRNHVARDNSASTPRPLGNAGLRERKHTGGLPGGRTPKCGSARLLPSPTLPPTHTYTLTHSHTHIHTHSLSHTHTLSISHTHTLSLCHTHTHTHTHTLSLTHTRLLSPCHHQTSPNVRARSRKLQTSKPGAKNSKRPSQEGKTKRPSQEPKT